MKLNNKEYLILDVKRAGQRGWTQFLAPIPELVHTVGYNRLQFQLNCTEKQWSWYWRSILKKAEPICYSESKVIDRANYTVYLLVGTYTNNCYWTQVNIHVYYLTLAENCANVDTCVFNFSKKDQLNSPSQSESKTLSASHNVWCQSQSRKGSGRF